MKLIIVDFETDKILSTVDNVSVVPSVNDSHVITTKEGYFDVDFVELNFVENSIIVHSAEYSLNQ